MGVKTLNFKVNLKSTTPELIYSRHKVYTNDDNAVKLEFAVQDFTAEELTTATASLLLYMRDGSFFQIEDANITKSGSTFSYTLQGTQGKHDGVAQAQLLVTIGAAELATQKYEFEIISGLDQAVAVEVMIQDWTTLTAEARAFIDQAELDEAQRISNENARIAAENQRINDFSSKADKTYVDHQDAALAAQLNEIKQEIPLIKASENLKNQLLRKIEKPEGFNWTRFPINIYRKSDGTIWTDLKIEDYIPVLTGQTYYVSMTGDNSNDGLTPATALRSVFAAMGKADVAEIVVYSGIYEDMYGFNNMSVKVRKSMIIRAAEGADVAITTRRFRPFSKTSGRTNVYQATRSLVKRVCDSKFLNDYGDFATYKLVADIEACDSMQGSWYTDGSVVYIHRLDSSAVVNGELFLFLDLVNLVSNGDYTIYLENIKLWGGNDGAITIGVTDSGQNPLLVAKNCEFKYATGGAGGLEILGADAILVNCRASSNFADGLNYHHAGGRKNNVIEINCTGIGNGTGRGTDTNNGSTIHDGGKIIRINGEYTGNEGPNVHDINLNTQSWNIDCVAHESKAVNPLRQSNFRIEDSGEMWLDNCKGFGSAGQLRATPGTKMYIRGGEYIDGTDTSDNNIYQY